MFRRMFRKLKKLFIKNNIEEKDDEDYSSMAGFFNIEITK